MNINGRNISNHSKFSSEVCQIPSKIPKYAILLDPVTHHGVFFRKNEYHHMKLQEKVALGKCSYFLDFPTRSIRKMELKFRCLTERHASYSNSEFCCTFCTKNKHCSTYHSTLHYKHDVTQNISKDETPTPKINGERLQNVLLTFRFYRLHESGILNLSPRPTLNSRLQRGRDSHT